MNAFATENCADRYEAAQNTRDIIENANKNNQAILDKLCALELDAKNDRISDLERQLTMANLSAALAIGGEPIQTSRAIVTPAAVDQYFNVTSIFFYIKIETPCWDTTPLGSS